MQVDACGVGATAELVDAGAVADGAGVADLFDGAAEGAVGPGGEVGAGAGFFSGLEAGNPFTVGGAPTSGALSMFAARIAGGLEVPVSGGWQARLTAASFSFSPPKAGLDASIERLLRFELTAGVGLAL